MEDFQIPTEFFLPRDDVEHALKTIASSAIVIGFTHLLLLLTLTTRNNSKSKPHKRSKDQHSDDVLYGNIFDKDIYRHIFGYEHYGIFGAVQDVNDKLKVMFAVLFLWIRILLGTPHVYHTMRGAYFSMMMEDGIGGITVVLRGWICLYWASLILKGLAKVGHVCSATCNHHRMHWDEEMEEMSRREGGFERCIESVYQLLG
eukprot:scaffold6415_cov233-Chaetoceros_neogracile.AAC.4